MAKGSVKIDEIRCKGCGLCADFCPNGVLTLDIGDINEKGYHPAGMGQPEVCTGCGVCALMCPDAAITVEREDL